MTRSNQMRARRSGVTLIELLVVATIMLTLAAVSVPTIKPMMESQATSHAAQTVSTYLERAKARAAATGRACGVTFECFLGTYNNDPSNPRGSASLVLRQVEEPPFFSGFDFGATAAVAPDFSYLFCNDANSPYYGQRVNKVEPLAADGASDLPTWNVYLHSNNDARIQFGSTGPFYPLINVGGAYYIVKIPGVELPIYTATSYKISRDPITTMTSPVGLAQGTVVDLEFSGTESSFFTLGSDVTVMFAPTGEVDYILDAGEKKSPSDTIYFLTGRWDRISALGVTDDGNETLAEDGLWNFEDGASFWVAINPLTGVISTAEVNQPFNYVLGDFDEGVAESREFARYSKRNIGGR